MSSQAYYDVGGAQQEDEQGEELLDFDRAMNDFREMFPRIPSALIENVLRKYDGDVSATINELLFDNSATSTAPASSSSNLGSSSTPGPGENVLTRLRRRRHEINEKLQDNQRLLDKVTDVDMAREYEDQQLALLLEHREVNTLISEEKAKRSPDTPKPSQPSKKAKKSINREPPTSRTFRRRSLDEERVPDGPLVVENGETRDFASKIKGTLKKVSGSRFGRLFSSP